MCCITQFIIKYVLFTANLVFSLAGLALVGVGIAVLLQLSDVLDVIPVPVNVIPISVIIVGVVIFLIAFFGCCGAIKENSCMLTTYSICMAVLAAVKIWLTVVIFRNLNNLNELVTEWLTTAFGQSNREPFHVMELAFSCCGTNGASSYVGVGSAIPDTCCVEAASCSVANSNPGCISIFTDYLETFGSATGGFVICIIGVEVVAMILGLFLAFAVSNKNK